MVIMFAFEIRLFDFSLCLAWFWYETLAAYISNVRYVEREPRRKIKLVVY